MLARDFLMLESQDAIVAGSLDSMRSTAIH
jgi:hypothetical protein